MQPELRHRLMITAGRLVGNIVRSIIGANPFAELYPGCCQTVADQINIRQLHVCAVTPLRERKRPFLKLPNELVVVHGRSSIKPNSRMSTQITCSHQCSACGGEALSAPHSSWPKPR